MSRWPGCSEAESGEKEHDTLTPDSVALHPGYLLFLKYINSMIIFKDFYCMFLPALL